MRKVLMLMMAVVCLAVLMAPPVSAQTYSSTFDGATYYSAPVSYVSPVSYSYSVPVSYSAPVSYSTAYYSSPATSTVGRYVNGTFHANDSSKYDKCPRCGTYHLPKGSKVTGVWRNATHSGVHVNYPGSGNTFSTANSYVNYASYQSSGGCRDGSCP